MITSASNERIKEAVKLRESARLREERGLYIAEGRRMCEEIAPEDLSVLYVTEAFAAENAALIARFGGWETVSDAVMHKLSGTQAPQGVFAVVRQRQWSFSDLAAGRPVLVLEGLQDPGNLGTILRSGEAAGIGGVIADRQTADRYNPKVVRATMGSLLRVPYLVCADLPEALSRLREAGYRIYAAHLRGERAYTQMDHGRPAAFLIGNEGRGLSDELTACADELLRIPMHGQVESLNAAVAAALMVFEWDRDPNY